jgi:hypothetical protein
LLGVLVVLDVLDVLDVQRGGRHIGDDMDVYINVPG